MSEQCRSHSKQSLPFAVALGDMRRRRARSERRSGIRYGRASPRTETCDWVRQGASQFGRPRRWLPPHSVLCVPACRGGACVATVWWRCTYPIWMARTARAVPTALLLGRSCGFGPHRPIRLRSQLLLSQVVPSSHASEGAVVVLPRTLCGAHTSAVATHVAQTDTHTCGHFLPSPDAHLSMQGPLGLGRPIRCDQQERVETAMPSITQCSSLPV